MQLCGKCGNHNSEEAIFCGHCANRLNNNCPACAFKNLWEQKFCGNCGKQLSTDSGLPFIAPQAPPASPVHEPVVAPAVSVSQGEMSSPVQSLPRVAAPDPARSVQSDLHSAMLTTQALPHGFFEGSLHPAASQIELIPGDVSHFDAQQDLPAYALLSIDFANWEQSVAESSDPAALERYRKQSLILLEERILAANGTISGSKRGILFVAFKREVDLVHSLAHAIRVAQTLFDLNFECQGRPLKLRMGMDVEVAQARNPLTSTIERTVGLPETLTVSDLVYQQVQSRFSFETIGPLPLGKQMMTFYRVLPEAQALPAADEVLNLTAGQSFGVPVAEPLATWTPVSPVAPGAVSSSVSSGALESVSSLSPEPVSFTVPPAPIPGESAHQAVPVSPQVPISPVSSVAPQASASPAEASPELSGTTTPSAFAADAPPSGTIAPELPHYMSPVLGLSKAVRQPNLSCEQAVDALASDLSGFLAQGVNNNKGRILSICAADGLGKSSVVHLARQKIDPEGQRAFWMGAQHYRCFHRDGLPLIFWLELVQNLLSLVFEGQPATEVRERIVQFLAHVYDGACPPEAETLLKDFLSVQPPQPLSVESRENVGRLTRFLLEMFRALAAQRPLVLVMEDLMYADSASLDLLAHLLDQGLLELPVYLILTQSRDFYPAGVLAEAMQKGPVKELVIAEMTAVEARCFLDDGPLGGRLNQFPATLIDAVLRHANGLPLYLEEALRLLHLQEVLIVDLETGKFVMNLESEGMPAPLPDSIKTLVRHRLEYLDEDSQYVLSLAAVLGEKFAVNMLMALTQMEEAPFNEALTTLFNHGYIMPDAVNTGRFRHGLIWESVYELMDVELQVEMHQLVSETLENDFNQGLSVTPLLIAYHSENGELPNRAMNYWNLTGIWAGQIGSLLGMNVAMFRALEVLEMAVPDQPLQTQELALRIGESLGIFNLEEQPQLSASLLEWVYYYRKAQGDAAKLIEPLGFLASAYENQGDYPRSLATLEKSMALIDPRAYPLEVASMRINKMDLLVMLGRFQQARELLQRDIDPVAQGPVAQGNADFMEAYLQAQLLKTQILLVQCDPAVGRVLEESMQISRERGLDGMTIALQLIRGQLLLRRGQYESCDQEADTLLRAIEALPESDWFLAQWGLLAMMYHCEMEDWASASQLVLTVISKAERVRDYHTWVVAQAYAGYIAGKSGKSKEARQLLEQAISLSSSHRFAAAALLAWRFLAEFELESGNASVAAELAGRALEIANKPEIQHTYESIQLSLLISRALLAQGQFKEAGKVLEPVWPRVTQVQWQPLIAACAFEVGQLYKHLAQTVPADVSRKYLARSVEFYLKAKGVWLELRRLPQVKQIDVAMPQL